MLSDRTRGMTEHDHESSNLDRKPEQHWLLLNGGVSQFDLYFGYLASDYFELYCYTSFRME